MMRFFRPLILAYLSLIVAGPSFARSPKHRAQVTPQTVSFLAESGARNWRGGNKIMRYATSEAVVNRIRLYIMLSSQNAGSGNTVFGLGSLTAENMTLFGSPVWGGGGGLSFNGTNQYAVSTGNLPSMNPSSGLSLFARFAKTTESNSDSFTSTNPESLASLTKAGSYDTKDLSFLLRVRGGKLNYLSRNLADTSYLDSAADSHDIDTQDLTTVSVRNASSASLYLNKTEVSYQNQHTGATLVEVGPLSLAVQNVQVPSRFFKGIYKAFAILDAEVTTTQRETITDLINAL